MMRVVRKKIACWHYRLVANGLLYMCAISFELINMLLFWSVMYSNGSVSKFLNTLVFIVFRLIL